MEALVGRRHCYTITADLAVAEAGEAREQVLGVLDGLGRAKSVSLGLDGPRPTQIALQLLVASAREADARGVTVELDANAEQALARVSPRADAADGDRT